MADASSSDTTSDCCIEGSSDITSEKSEYVVVGRKPYPSHRRSKRNFLQKLLIREVSDLNLHVMIDIVIDSLAANSGTIFLSTTSLFRRKQRIAVSIV